jgi:predicted RNA-binding Zn-ribbon protein involved in translation (DUF1610 family)
MPSQPCPACGALMHRSRSRSALGRSIGRLFMYKAYRCSECGWRGRLYSGQKPDPKRSAVAIYLWLVAAILTLLLAFYIINSRPNSAPSNGQDSGIAP